MKQIIWDKCTKTEHYFWLEQGQVKSAALLPKSKMWHRLQAVVLLPADKTEARFLRLPMAPEQKTQQMVALALQSNNLSWFKWQIVQQKEGWQQIFGVLSTDSIAKDSVTKRQGAEFLSVYDGLLLVGQLVDISTFDAAVTFYWGDGLLTLLFWQKGLPIHGQTVTGLYTAEAIAEAYQRMSSALIRQELWQDGQRIYGLWEKGSERLMMQKLGVLLADKLIVLNDQPPFAQWEKEDGPLLVRLLLEKTGNAWHGRHSRREIFASMRQTKNKLAFCGILTVIMGLCWLGSGILLEQAQQKERPLPFAASATSQNETDYGEILSRLATQQGNARLQEIHLTENGLEIYAEASNWQDAAALGQRLQALAEVRCLTIKRAEKLQRLQENVPTDFVALTIGIELEGGGYDER